jgi:hypothetical protein
MQPPARASSSSGMLLSPRVIRKFDENAGSSSAQTILKPATRQFRQG